jgi:hypothetical protein
MNIPDGIQFEGVEEEFEDKNSYYDLINKAEDQKGALDRNKYKIYNSTLNKYGMN